MTHIQHSCAHPVVHTKHAARTTLAKYCRHTREIEGAMMQAIAHTPVPLPVACGRPELEARGQCDNASSRSGQQLGPRLRWRGASLAVRASACVESMAANLE
eukprot:scaffold29302_cov150-Isochrysis_galbana.AAC.2